MNLLMKINLPDQDSTGRQALEPFHTVIHILIMLSGTLLHLLK